jgi:hypothetical protein
MGLSDRGVQALAAAPGLANVRELYLLGNTAVTSTGARALADSPYLAKLEHLNLADTGVRYVGVEALTSSPRLKALRSLTMQEFCEGEGEQDELNPKMDPRIDRLLRKRFGQ